MEDYQKKYEQALDNFKKIKAANKDNKELVDFIEDEYPELKESEDEKIRKEILQSIKDNMIVIHKDKCIAWLEKQGEQKPTDKVEPKFKVGDWVTNGINFTFQVRSIEDNMYLRSDEYFIDIETADKTFRLWTIQDAKDGDVLVVENIIFIYKRILGSHIVSHCKLINDVFESWEDGRTCCEGNKYVHPATKEQRDTLMKAMADAGYTFDFEKKELKKIEQTPISIVDDWIEDYWKHYKVNNPDSYDKGEEIQFDHDGFVRFCQTHCPKCAWSEEDEVCCSDVNAAISDYFDEGYAEELKDWLKSLKERYTWKPSDEQMKALNYVINLMASSESPTENDYYYNVFKNMRTHLKKLKEE